MNVLLISASDSGGAGIACLRLLRALRQTGANVRMLVLRKSSDDNQVFEWVDPYAGAKRKVKKLRLAVAQFRADRTSRILTSGRQPLWDAFTPPRPAILNASHPFVRWADIVHLHWCAQFWDLRCFSGLSGKKVFWTFHDLNPVTGGCHFPGDCEQFWKACALCPQLEGARRPQAVKGFFAFKKRMLARADHVTIISPSQWISDQARKSSLLEQRVEHKVIPYTFDETIFRRLEQAPCRDLLSIPRDKKVVLFAASFLGNHRKGMDILMESIRRLSNEGDILFVAAGKGNAASSAHIQYLGNIPDERLMAIVYNAADVTVVPSREDNLPNTVGESLCCGTPVVGFRRGGIPDLIKHGVNGILVIEVSSDALAEGVRKAVTSPWQRDAIARTARGRFARKVIADLHIEAYRSAAAT